MIKELSSFITNEQIDIISNLIQERVRMYRNFTNKQEYQSMFLEEYKPHEKNHSVSWAIKGIFPSGKDVAGFQVKRIKDKGGHTRPELSNGKIIMHILSDKTDFNAKYLQEKYSLNSNGFDKPPIYCYIRFEVQNKWLQSLVLNVPDKNGKVIASETLFTKPDIKEVSA